MLNTDELEEKLKKEYEQLQKESKKANILILGGTGVGKSSLINMVFGAYLAEVDTGAPVTSQIEKFEKEGLDVVLYDSIGYEIGSEEEKRFFAEASQLIETKTGADAIHIAWYFISAANHRITDFDIEQIKKLKEKKLNIAVGLTKTDLVSDEDITALKTVLKGNSATAALPVFSLSTTKPEISEHFGLLNWSKEMLPEQIAHSFVRAQQASIELKWDTAKKWIAGHVSGAALVGASPIPFSDAPILLANQSFMIAKILHIYGLDSIQNIVTEVGLAGILKKFVPRLAKSLIGNLLKFIPGLGTVAGGAINAGVAGAITYAMGFGINYACYKITKSILNKDWDQVKSQIESFSQIVGEYAKDAIKNGKKTAEDYSLEIK